MVKGSEVIQIVFSMKSRVEMQYCMLEHAFKLTISRTSPSVFARFVPVHCTYAISKFWRLNSSSVRKFISNQRKSAVFDFPQCADCS